MPKSFQWWMRKSHRWGSAVSAIPLLLIIVSGLFLQLKKEIDWVQPPAMQGSENLPQLSWERILEVTKNNRLTSVASWDDISRLDVRPSRGLIKVQCKNGWELQLDSSDGSVLLTAYRRSDLIESLHDGSFFSESVKLWVFFPAGILLLSLWISGMYLWCLPVAAKWKKRKSI